MNGEGIMGLPMEGAPMPAPAQGGQVFSPEQASAIEFARSQTTPEEITNETMNALQQADPALVLELKQTLAGAQLPQEVLDVLKRMVDEILADPASYQELRADILSDPEVAEVLGELLPPTFDVAFFSGLRVALDQVQAAPPIGGMGMMGGMPIQGFASGGIVELPAMRQVASELQKMGRNGDTMLAHITPSEARMLKRMGGSGTINPYTGLPEFFLKAVGKAIKGVVKGVGKAVGGVVKALGSAVKKIASSNIGRIALTMAGVYFMGPAGLNLAAGSLGVTNAALAMGINTFAASTVVNLASGMKPGDALKQGLLSGVLAGVGTGVAQGFDAVAPGVPAAPGTPGAPPVPGVREAEAASQMPVEAPVPGQPIAAPGGIGTAADLVGEPGVPTVTDTRFPPPPAPIETAQREIIQQPQVSAPAAAPAPAAPAPAAPAPAATTAQGIGTLDQGPNIFEKAYQSTKDFFSPAARAQEGILEAAQKADQAAAAYKASTPNATAEMVKAVRDEAFKAAQPGVITKYGPLAAVGLGATKLLGGFEQPQPDPDPLKDERERYYESLRSVEPLRVGGGYYGTYEYQPLVATGRPYDIGTPVYQAKKGSSPQGVTHFPRKTGPIDGPGTGTSDSIPAMLSDGEFVFTAKAVRNFGNGSRRKGAARMYKLMKMLEGGPVKKDGIASLAGAKRG